MARRVLPLLVLALATGCAPDLTRSSLLVRSRALAATIAVTGEPTRSNPAPGESADVVIHFGDPGAEPARTWLLLVCEPVPTTFGAPICAGAPIAFEVNDALDPSPPFAPPGVSFSVPAADALMAETTELVMVGAVCSGGVVDQEAMEAWIADFADGTASGEPPVCMDGAGEGELVTLRIPLLRDDQENTQPVIDALRRDAVPMTATAPRDAPATGCVALGSALPVIPVTSGEILLELEVTPDSAESFTEIDDVTGAPREVTESLQIEYVATAGELDRTFGFIDPGENTVLDRVGWELPAPEEVPADGLLVRFYISVRDGRGGVDFEERAMCVVPDVGG